MQNENVKKTENILHKGFICDGCNNGIRGILWHCRECGDAPSTSYDLCQDCKDNGIFTIHQHEIGFDDLIQPQGENLKNITLHTLVPISTPLYLLHEASVCGNLEVVDNILALSETNVNLRWQGSSPLCKAVESGKTTVVTRLLRHPDLDPNLRTVEGVRSPLELAMENENEPIALLLLGHPNIEVDCAAGYLTCLHLAAKLGFASAFEKILSLGADAARVDSSGVSVLHAACGSCGNLEIVEKLLSFKKVDINAVDCDGNTPLTWAVHGEKVPIIKLLLEKGADSTVVNHNLSSLLHAAVCNGHEIITKLLLSHLKHFDQGKRESILYAPDKFGHSSMYYAVTYENENLVRMLFDAGHDVNHKESDQDTLLHIAVRSQDFHMIHLLLTYGADPNLLNAQLNSPLHYATQYVLKMTLFNEILLLFLDFGVDFDARGYSNYRSSTIEGALNMAIGSHKISFAALLIRYGCNVNVKTSYSPFFGRGSFKAIEESAFEQALRLDERNLCLLLFSAGSKFPVADTSDCHQFFYSSLDWFNVIASKPRRLTDIARLRVRTSLTDFRAETLSRLSLPARLTDFLMFDDFRELWNDD